MLAAAVLAIVAPASLLPIDPAGGGVPAGVELQVSNGHTEVDDAPGRSASSSS